MKATVILIIVGALGTIPKSLEKKMRELEVQGRTEITDVPDQQEYLEKFLRPECNILP